MTDQRTIDRVLVHLRTHLAELRRLEREGGKPEELEERKRTIRRLQRYLGYSLAASAV